MQNIFLSLILFFTFSSFALADASNPTTAQQTTQVAANYRIVAGDVLDISVWKEEGLASKALVRPDGGISFPLVGNLQAEGLTTEELKQEISKRLRDYLSDPSVTVAVINTTQKIYIMGKVNKPGEVLLARPITVMQALAMAGGLSPFADEDDIKILRRKGSQTISLPFDYGSISKGENLEQNIDLLNGDVVLVP